jgi:hypothetical protein
MRTTITTDPQQRIAMGPHIKVRNRNFTGLKPPGTICGYVYPPGSVKTQNINPKILHIRTIIKINKYSNVLSPLLWWGFYNIYIIKPHFKQLMCSHFRGLFILTFQQ